MMGLRKGNLKRETESLLIAAQNNAIRTNHIKARIDKTQQNSKCRLCDNRDEIINPIISECSKLAEKKYKTIYDCVGRDPQGISLPTQEIARSWNLNIRTNICAREWDTQTPMGFWHTNGLPNRSQTTRLYNNQQQQQKRELAEFWTWLSQNWRKLKRRISTWTLLGNWKNRGTL